LNKPDVELNAEVKSRWLRFGKVPPNEIRFPGYSEGKSMSETERVNLPDKVEEDVTYRDSLIRLRSAGNLIGDESTHGEDAETDKGVEAQAVARAIRDTRADNGDSRREERR
jgi:hypothetical protein